MHLCKRCGYLTCHQYKAEELYAGEGQLCWDDEGYLQLPPYHWLFPSTTKWMAQQSYAAMTLAFTAGRYQ